MLTEEQVKTLLVCRIEACCKSCNSYHINHVEGQIRALLAVLTGEIPPLTQDATEILRLAGIPCKKWSKGRFSYDEAWLIEHGFIVNGEEMSHPDFKSW